jgi:hypothetical protein
MSKCQWRIAKQSRDDAFDRSSIWPQRLQSLCMDWPSISKEIGSICVRKPLTINVMHSGLTGARV